MIAKFMRLKIFLNMNSKTNKEDRSCDDIAFLSEIISDFIFWQEYQKIVKHFFSPFFRQHSPGPDRTGFF
jgi:hypothetical protein